MALFLLRWLLLLSGLALVWLRAPKWVAWSLAGALAVAGWLRMRAFSGAWKEGVRRSKASVLLEAAIKVHAVRRMGERDGIPQYEIDVTVTPRPGNARLRPWEPNALRLASAGAKEVDLVRVHVKEGAQLVSAVGRVVKGPQQLRVLAECPQHIRSLTLQYFGTDIGEIEVK